MMKSTIAVVFIALFSSSFAVYITETFYESDTSCSGDVVFARTTAEANPYCFLTYSSLNLYGSITCDNGVTNIALNCTDSACANCPAASVVGCQVQGLGYPSIDYPFCADTVTNAPSPGNMEVTYYLGAGCTGAVDQFLSINEYCVATEVGYGKFACSGDGNPIYFSCSDADCASCTALNYENDECSGTTRWHCKGPGNGASAVAIPVFLVAVLLALAGF